MGILGGMAKLTAKKAVDVALTKEALKHTQREVAKKTFYPNKLLVSKKGMFSKRDLRVKDEDGVVRYRILLSSESATHASVYDGNGNSLASLSRVSAYKTGWLGMSVESKRYEVCQGEGFGKKTLGYITPDNSDLPTTRLLFDFNGWQVTSKLVSTEHSVFDGHGNQVAQILETIDSYDPYVIGFANAEIVPSIVIALTAIELDKYSES